MSTRTQRRCLRAAVCLTVGAIVIFSALVTSAASGPPNDDVARAQSLSGSCPKVTGSNKGASRESWETKPYAGSSPSHSVWYSWYAPVSGPVTLDTAGSDFTTVLAVYNTRPPSSNPLKSSLSRVQFNAVKGTTYYLVVDGVREQTGNFRLMVTSVCAAAPAGDGPAPARDVGKTKNPDVVVLMGSRRSSTNPDVCDLRIYAGNNQQWSPQIVPARLNVCLSGFQPGVAFVQLLRPDGTVRPPQPQRVYVGAGYGFWPFRIPFVDTPGEYTVRVTQNDVLGTGTFTLADPSQPRIQSEPSIAPSGSLFTVYLAGFSRNAEVLLDLYSRRDCSDQELKYCEEYQRSFSVRTNASGQASSILCLEAPEPLVRLQAVSSSGARASTLVELRASNKAFDNPAIDQYRLDWCNVPGDQCGQAAANEWCKTKGYAAASRFEEDVDIGQRGIRTRVLTTGDICSAGYCDSFRSITCIAFNPIYHPTVDGYRLDWCFNNGDQCGAPAANAWCQSQGYLTAIAFEQDNDVGRRNERTKVLNTGYVCDSPTCDSFKGITCSN